MKKYALLTLLILSTVSCFSRRTMQSVQVQPAFWWSGMVNPSLQIMLRAEGVGKSEVSIEAADIQIDSIFRPTNTNYLFIYLNVGKAAPCKFDIQLRRNGKVQTIPYELRQRDQAVKAQGFD